jgi:hypothetical protein
MKALKKEKVAINNERDKLESVFTIQEDKRL